MEWIHTAVSVGTILFDTLIDPFSAVSGDELDACPLLWGKLLEKLLKDGFAMPLGYPDDIAGVVVDYRCDIFVAFTVAGLIHTDSHKVVEAFFRTDIQILFYSGDNRANRIP